MSAEMLDGLQQGSRNFCELRCCTGTSSKAWSFRRSFSALKQQLAALGSRRAVQRASGRGPHTVLLGVDVTKFCMEGAPCIIRRRAVNTDAEATVMAAASAVAQLPDGASRRALAHAPSDGNSIGYMVTQLSPSLSPTTTGLSDPTSAPCE